jgi:alkylation response protein AidB-like acyl-CoA dehydrogenase
VAKVRAHSTETALKASSKLIELAGSRGSQRADGLDRHWRNARVIPCMMLHAGNITSSVIMC